MRALQLWFVASVLSSTAAAHAVADRPKLRVCADPNNLPFSNRRGEGFENRLAELVARDLGRELLYVWRPQRRGFIRNGLSAGACDVVMGLPSRNDMALTTRPYYRSTYVVVARGGAPHRIRSFDDPALRDLRIGVQLIGDDYANSPPAHALARRGLVRGLVGYTVYGDYGEPNPPARVITAVARGEVDIAFAWGPMAGYFVRRSQTPLTLTPLAAERDDPGLPMTFAISMAVRPGDLALRAALDQLIVRRRSAIAAILAAHGVPRLQVDTSTSSPGRASRPARQAAGP